MKTIGTILLGITLITTVCGCASFLGGLAGGAAGAGAGYELSARQQMKELDEDLKSGRIDEDEYKIRKSQIERGSLVY